MKNTNLTQLDANQVTSREHDQENDAKRVFLVGGEKLNLSIDSDKIAKAVKEGLSGLKLDGITQQDEKKDDKAEPHFNVITVEKQVFIPQIEYKTIEVPVIVKETEYKEIEKPIYITKYETIEGHKDSNEVPKWVKFVLASQALTTLGILIAHFLK